MLEKFNKKNIDFKEAPANNNNNSPKVLLTEQILLNIVNSSTN